MKQLSYWASRNVRAARWLIGGCYLMANILGYCWAVWLHAADVHVAPSFVESLVLVTIIALFVHPRKTRLKAPGYTYLRHKSCDFVICLCTVALVACCTGKVLEPITPSYASIRWHKTAGTADESKRVEQSEKGAVHGIQRVFRNARRWYSELGVAEKVVLVTLVIAATVVFCYFWVGVCCSLACSGYDALAIVAAFVGFPGAIIGCVFLCRRIIRGPRFKGPRLRTSGDAP